MKRTLIPHVNENKRNVDYQIYENRVLLNHETIIDMSLDAVYALKKLKENNCEYADQLKMSINDMILLFVKGISETKNLKVQLAYSKQLATLNDIKELLTKITS